MSALQDDGKAFAAGRVVQATVMPLPADDALAVLVNALAASMARAAKSGQAAEILEQTSSDLAVAFVREVQRQGKEGPGR